MIRQLVALALLAVPVCACAKLLPGAKAASECFSLADWTLQAGEALRAGVPLERHLAADDGATARAETRRAAAQAVYRDRPRDLSDYIAARLGACLRAGGIDLGDHAAKACYDRTLWAGTFFAWRRQGVPLERLVESYARAGIALADLAEAVYRTEKSEPDFRQDLFLDCAAN